MAQEYPLYVGGVPRETGIWLEVTNKYTGEVFAKVALARKEDVEEGVQAAWQSRRAMATLPAYRRREILLKVKTLCEDRSEELAQILSLEAGKPIRESRKEVFRMLHTLEIAAEETVRLHGEVLPLDRHPVGEGHIGYTRYVPAGVCSLITPFNFPLNLAAHKFAPAIGAGCPFLLKPSPYTPVSAAILGEIFSVSGLPEGAFSILPAHPEVAELLVTHPQVALLSFTGSQIGWQLKQKAGKKKVLLELGGNAACVVDETVSSLGEVAKRVTIGAFYQSGQVCISVQRIYLHTSIWDEFLELFLQEVKQLKVGNPLEEETFIGPLIDDRAAERLEGWIQSACERGAEVLWGGQREGRLFFPTVLAQVPPDHPLSCEEAFGPVAVVEPFEDFEEVLARVNQSPYGLQAGIFTSSISRAHRAWEVLEVGGVMINEIPTWRIDQMPYGGVKNSGLGREGLYWAMREMSELRLMVVRL